MSIFDISFVYPGISGDFRVSYDVEHPDDAGLVQVEDEYFAHYFSPNEVNYSPLGKTRLN